MEGFHEILEEPWNDELDEPGLVLINKNNHEDIQNYASGLKNHSSFDERDNTVLLPKDQYSDEKESVDQKIPSSKKKKKKGK